MRAADLDDLVPLLGLGRQVFVQPLERGDQVAGDRHAGGNVHRRRERVVRRLAHVDVVVGMDGPFLALRADAETQPMVRQVGDHFVGVHVGRSAGAGLIDVDREMVVVLARRRLSSQAAMIALASFSSSLPSSRLACAQAAFRWPKAWIRRPARARGRRESCRRRTGGLGWVLSSTLVRQDGDRQADADLCFGGRQPDDRLEPMFRGACRRY